MFCLFAIGCGKGQRVGSEKLTDFEERAAEKCRLGQECPTPTPSSVDQGAGTSLALGKSPTAAPPPPPPPQQPQEQTYTISLVADTPWFQDNAGQGSNRFQIQVGATLKVVNKDNTEERPTRSFTASNKDFDSGPMAPGATWTYKLARTGSWEVQDHRAPFIQAILDVY